MFVKLVTVTTADRIELDGAIYNPTEISRRTGSILMVHGLTWNFYRGPSRWLPPLLAIAGIRCLSLNMRDHDQSEPRDFELTHHDLYAGIEYLAGQGNEEIILLGHGYACNKLVCYPSLSGDHRSSRRILITLGAVKTYRPDIWDMVLRLAPEMRGDTLVVQGAADPLIEAKERSAELRSAASNSQLENCLLEGANHYFDQRHQELAECILEWIGRTSRASEK